MSQHRMNVSRCWRNCTALQTSASWIYSYGGGGRKRGGNNWQCSNHSGWYHLQHFVSLSPCGGHLQNFKLNQSHDNRYYCRSSFSWAYFTSIRNVYSLSTKASASDKNGIDYTDLPIFGGEQTNDDDSKEEQTLQSYLRRNDVDDPSLYFEQEGKERIGGLEEDDEFLGNVFYDSEEIDMDVFNDLVNEEMEMTSQKPPPQCPSDLIEGWHVEHFGTTVSIQAQKWQPGCEEYKELETLASQLEDDAYRMLGLIGRYGVDLPVHCDDARGIAEWELSVVLVDDEHIRDLNQKYRGKNCATDVLSFPQLPDKTIRSAINVWLLGDVVISIETAKVQAHDHGHELIDELRILLLHGLLHLIGYDHEDNVDAAIMMGDMEWEIMETLGWKTRGLIQIAGSFDPHSDKQVEREKVVTRASKVGEDADTQRLHVNKDKNVKLVALDLDGTLLDSNQSVTDETIAAIKLALSQGVNVIAATGKARSSAIDVLSRVGLANVDSVNSSEKGIVGIKSPGIFLQGLTTYNDKGNLLPGPSLDMTVVLDAFLYSLERNVELVGFVSDTSIDGVGCVTMRNGPLVEELHYKYSEPKAKVLGSIDELLSVPVIYKLLFLDKSPNYVQHTLRPEWEKKLIGKNAECVQAIDYMLEILPQGVNKAQGLHRLLKESFSTIDLCDIMVVGDGENDIAMLNYVRNGNGVSVAMGNASASVSAAASYQVATNNDNGVAEAFGRFVL